MKHTQAGDTWVRLENGTAWKRPGDALDEIGWRLRYGTPSTSDLLVAAETIAAYVALLAKSQKRRNEIASAINGCGRHASERKL